MSKAIETLDGADAAAFRTAIAPHVRAASLEMDTSVFALASVKQFADHVLGHGTIHATALKLVNSPALDQFEALEAAILKCSELNMALDITGLEIRVGKQDRFDPAHLYINGALSSGPNGTGLAYTYGVKVGAGGFVRIVGKGTIGHLEQDQTQYLLFCEDAEYVEIGDGVTMDGGKTKNQGGGGTCYFMGCEHVHIGNATFINDGIVRCGSSASGPGKLLTFTTPRFYDCWGTHCLGCKPGSTERIVGDTVYGERVLGVLKVEAEDQNGFNDDGEGGKIWSDRVTAKVNCVIGKDINGVRVGSGGAVADSNGHTFAFEESTDGVAIIGSIITYGAQGSGGVASSLNVTSGQTAMKPKLIQVGHIHCENGAQAISLRPGPTGLGQVMVGKITGNPGAVVDLAIGGGGKPIITMDYDGGTAPFAVGEIITGATSGSKAEVVRIPTPGTAAGTMIVQAFAFDAVDPTKRVAITSAFADNEAITGSFGGAAVVNGALRIGQLDMLSIDNVDVSEVTQEAFRFENAVAAYYPGYLAKMIRLNNVELPQSKWAAMASNTVKAMEIGDFHSGNTLEGRAGQFYGSDSFYFKGGSLRVKRSLVSDTSHNRFLNLDVTDESSVIGLDIKTTRGGAAALLNGAGKVTLKDGQIRAAYGAGLNRNGTNPVHMQNFRLNGTSFNFSPVQVEGGDLLASAVTNWTPGAVAAGVPATIIVDVANAAISDKFEVEVTSAMTGPENFLFTSWRSATGKVTVALHDVAGGGHNPGTFSFILRGRRVA